MKNKTFAILHLNSEELEPEVMKKIAIISNTSAAILNFRKHLIKFLLKNQYQVFCFAVDYNDDSKNRVRKLGAEAVDYKLSRGGLNPFSDIYYTYKLSRQIRNIQPDVVLSTFVKPVIYGTIASKLAKVKKTIGMLEGLGYFFTDQPEGISTKTKLIKSIQILLYKIALPKADAVFFLNNDDRKDLVLKYSIPLKDFRVLGPIGLDLREYPTSKPLINPVTFIFIGRLLKEKGIFEYLAAAGIVKKKFPSAVFYVVGGLDKENPGALKEDELKHYVENGIVEYPGLVNNIQEWIAKSSVFVLPSYREGFPRSTQEAMAMGRAIITTDVPGCRDTVTNYNNGFLITRWSIDELVEKMIYFIDNPDAIIRMGQASALIAKEMYDAEKVNKEMVEFIENMR